VTDPHKAARQHMQQKPAQEFVGRHGHCALLVPVCVVLPLELSGTVALVDGAQSRLRQEQTRGTPLRHPRPNPVRPSRQGAALASPVVFLLFAFESKERHLTPGATVHGPGVRPRFR
jgi:hypothetical protein